MNILSILGNTTITLTILAGILLGAVYVTLHFKPEKRVELLRPRDSRGKILKAIRETDLGITCKKVGGVTYRFIKAGRGWTFNVSGKMITKFFGLEGTAYTAMIKGNEIVEVPLAEYLRHLWTDAFYDKIPATQKEAVETDVVGVTIQMQKINEEEWNLPTLTGDDIHDEGDSSMMRRFAKETQEGQPKSWINFIIAFGIGALTMYLAIGKGWF